MELPRDNPIVMLWRNVKGAGDDLGAAVARARHPSFAEGLTDPDDPRLVYVSPDDLTVNVPLEFLCPTGEPADFIGLQRVLPRAAGVLRYGQASGEATIKATGPPAAIVFGDPWQDGARRLPGARAEAGAVKGALPGQFGLLPDGRMHLTGQATLERFHEGLAQSPWIIHFAGHGHFAEQEPLLLFAGTDMPAPRGLLIERLDGTPLVMLNACVAGITPTMGGQYRGLPEAFLSRGAAAVIASCFPLADFPATHFSRLFYEELAEGNTVGEALLHARRTVGSAPDAHPLHWGLYVPWGNVNARLPEEVTGPA